MLDFGNRPTQSAILSDLFLALSRTKEPLSQLPTRVARWFILRPKIPLWELFGGPKNGKC
jgi:hypothetical protein